MSLTVVLGSFFTAVTMFLSSTADVFLGLPVRGVLLMVFKSCRIHRIYELNAHERHHKVVVTRGKLEIFFKPRVSELGACQ